MPRRNVLVTFVICLLAAATFAAYHAYRTPVIRHIRLAAGSPGGTYDAMAKGIKAAVEQRLPNVRITIIETGGSDDNIKLVATGKADLCFAQSGNSSAPHLKTVASLYPEVLQIVARADGELQTLHDLVGKRLSLGAAGGGTHRVAEIVLNHYGVRKADYEIVHLGFEDAVTALTNGKIDAAFLVAGLPTEALAAVPTDGSFRFLPIDHGAALAARHAFLRESDIPQGLYAGSPPFPGKDIRTLSVSATLLAHDQLDDNLVHKLTATLFLETGTIITEGHTRAADLDESFAQDRPPFPLHPGAHSYYHRQEPPISADFSEFLGLLISLLIPAVGMLWAVVCWITKRKKDRIDQYYGRLHNFFERTHAAKEESEAALIEREMIAMKHRAFQDLIAEKLRANDAFLIFQREFSFCFDYVLTKRRMLRK